MYITFYKQEYKTYQLSLEDFFNGKLINNHDPAIKTITVKRDQDKLKSFFMSHVNPKWFEIPKHPEWPIEEIKDHYHTFHIPKKSGGLRRIDAPDDELKEYLRRLKDYFESVLMIIPHNAAHAYVKNRSTVTAIKEHQRNNSKWFLKLDMKDFFPAHNLEYTLKKLKEIYPIGILMDDPEYADKLKEALSYAFLDNKLPQGTPLSPTLTNILMTGIDLRITGNNQMVYTRYADDLLISSKTNFNWSNTVKIIIKILKEEGAPFRLNEEKTRYGSREGRNWNLGIMLNKDNRMTIGHKQNQRFRAALFSILQDHKNGIKWDITDRQILGGQIAYYKAIDPEYTELVIKRYEQKFNVKLKDILKEES
jgi:hypothetical protein